MTIQFPSKIVSGGQTGGDRGGLDAGLALGLPIGGYCPAGRRAEDGRIPDVYPMIEVDETNYLVRTERNARESDATVVFNAESALSSGCAATVRYAKKAGKPYLVLKGGPTTLGTVSENAGLLARWLAETRPAVLNVAGNRESSVPGLQSAVAAVLAHAIRAAQTIVVESQPDLILDIPAAGRRR